jgi:hypothetical protein
VVAVVVEDITEVVVLVVEKIGGAAGGEGEWSKV